MTFTTSNVSGALLDSDYIISLSVNNEFTHVAAKALSIKLGDTPQFILQPIWYELATVSSRKFGHEIAHNILHDVKYSTVQTLEITKFEQDIWKEYYSHKKKDISFFDCANLVAARYYGLKIASFDRFYPKSILA